MDESSTMQGETPVSLVIRLLGIKRLAVACDLTTSAIDKWGDLVPAKHQASVLNLAAERDVPLTAGQLMGVEPYREVAGASDEDYVKPRDFLQAEETA